MENGSFEKIRFLPSHVLEELLHQMKIDPSKYQEDITEIEQELIIRTMPYCKPVVDLIKG